MTRPRGSVHVELVIRGESAGFYKALLRACGVGTAKGEEVDREESVAEKRRHGGASPERGSRALILYALGYGGFYYL